MYRYTNLKCTLLEKIKFTGQKSSAKADRRKDEDKKGSIRSSVITTTETEASFSEHKLKYKLCRVAVDAVDFWLVESGAALQLWVRIYFY